MKPITIDIQEGNPFSPNGLAWLMYESSGNLVDSTINGIIGFIEDYAQISQEASPFGGYCLFFNNAVDDESFFTEGSLYYDNPNFWIAFWMKPSVQYATTAILIRNFSYYFLGIKDDKLDFGSTEDNLSSVEIEYGVWQHVVVTCTEGVVKLYLDGVPVGEFDLTEEIFDFEPVYYGNNFGGGGYVGRLDSILISGDVSLTDEQVTLLYTDHWRGFHPSEDVIYIEDSISISESIFSLTVVNLFVADVLSITDNEYFYNDPITITESSLTITESFIFNWIFTESLSDGININESLISELKPRIYEQLIKDRLTFSESLNLNKNISLIISDILDLDEGQGGNMFLNYIDHLNVPSIIGVLNDGYYTM